ncbi:MAG: hypothetical protein ACKO2P_04755 [Planctomycetota bacterium]
MSTAPADLQPCRSRTCCPQFVWVVLCVVVAFVALGNAGRAETCGHYLFRNGQPVAGFHATSHSPHAAVPVQPQRQLPFPPPVPCNGPGCRKQSAPMFPVPAAPVTHAGTDPAAILNLLLSAQPSVDSLNSPQSERGELWVAAEIFRPPTAC